MYKTATSKKPIMVLSEKDKTEVEIFYCPNCNSPVPHTRLGVLKHLVNFRQCEKAITRIGYNYNDKGEHIPRVVNLSGI
jgi:hypothetical protein